MSVGTRVCYRGEVECYHGRKAVVVKAEEIDELGVYVTLMFIGGVTPFTTHIRYVEVA